MLIIQYRWAFQKGWTTLAVDGLIFLPSRPTRPGWRAKKFRSLLRAVLWAKKWQARRTSEVATMTGPVEVRPGVRIVRA